MILKTNTTFIQPSFGEFRESDFAATLKASDSKRTDPGAVVIESAVSSETGSRTTMNMKPVANTLDAMHDAQAVLHDGKPPRKYIVRRLTPLECCRLQGFPDWWCDGANGSDSAQYKLWGNGVALPCVAFIMERIANGGKRYENAAQL